MKQVVGGMVVGGMVVAEVEAVGLSEAAAVAVGAALMAAAASRGAAVDEGSATDGLQDVGDDCSCTETSPLWAFLAAAMRDSFP